MDDGYAKDSYGVTYITDPFKRWVSGRALGSTDYRMPTLTKITDTLYLGGSGEGLILPREVEHVVALDDQYPYDRYDSHKLKSNMYVQMEDSFEQDPHEATRLVDWMNKLEGVIMVHCHMGLNRSALVAALYMYYTGEVKGMPEIISELREKRSPAVLCNPVFEKYLLKNF